MSLKLIKTAVPAFERFEIKLILPVVAGFSFHIALCSCIIVIKPGYETRLLDVSPQLPPQSTDRSNDVTMSLLSGLFWYSEIWGEKRKHLSFYPLWKSAALECEPSECWLLITPLSLPWHLSALAVRLSSPLPRPDSRPGRRRPYTSWQRLFVN